MATSGPRVSEALDRIREAIGDSIPDSTGAYRWSDERIFRWLSDAREEIVSKHPEAGYVESVIRQVFTEIVGGSEYLGIVRHYLGDLVELTVAKIMVGESEDAANLNISNDQIAKAGMAPGQ